MTLEEAREHVGHTVAYRPDRGPVEDGTIMYVGPKYVFVRYGHQIRATHPKDLMLS